MTASRRSIRQRWVASAGTLLLLAGVLPASAAAPLAVRAVSPDVVISQIYGGGGNSGATLTNDFIELFNRGTSTVSLTGWSVQYASATGTGNFAATPLSGSIAPGQYYLVQQAAGAGGTTALPTPDATGSIAMAAGSGKVIVANVSTGLACNGGSTPCPAEQLAQIVDLVGYGTANFFEGTAAPTLSNTTAALRAGNGCTDTDSNAADFSAGDPTPRNSASPLNPCAAGDAAPAVLSTVPEEGATGVASTAAISITFGEPVDLNPAGVVLLCLAGTVGATLSGGPTTFTLTPLAMPDGPCTVSIDASSVTDQDSDDPPDTMAADFSLSFTVGEPPNVCADPYTPIYDIQGDGLAAAITGTVTTQGLVVGDFEGSAGLQGFYLQDLAGDEDPTTSDGIFVFTGSGNAVSEGQVVRVTGFARERFSQTAINGANNNNAAVTDVVDCGTGSVEPVDVEMPFPDATYLERYEGMLVRFPQPLVIAEYFNYDRFGEIVLALPLDGDDRPFTPTAVEQPGEDAQARLQENLLRRITLDDGLGVQNPSFLRHPNGMAFSLDNRFRGGDTVTDAVGVLGFDFSLYRIQPTAPSTYTAVNPRPAAPDPVGGSLTVASFNVLNYFTTIDAGADICGPLEDQECRGADDLGELARQRVKILSALGGMAADVVGLIEIENHPGDVPTADLVAGLNEELGAGTYAYVPTGAIGSDAIRQALIYRPSSVVPVGDWAILDSSVDSRFLDDFNRPVLAQAFEEVATGARFTVAVNHLKSKGSDCNAIGDPDTGDGQGNCNQTRLAAAEALVDWLESDPTGSGDRDYLIIGDLNAYTLEDPTFAILAGPDGTPGTADDYTNLIAEYVGDAAYSFVFDGQFGYLDHALASSTLAGQVTGATVWNINADEPDVLDYDTTFKPDAQDALFEPNAFRSSDHDPVIVGLSLLNLGFSFSDFAPPIRAAGEATAKAGSTVSIRFGLGDADDVTPFFGAPQTYLCGSPGDERSPAASAGRSTLRYDDVAEQYVFGWKTSPDWAGSCRAIEFILDDGTYVVAAVTFRR